MFVLRTWLGKVAKAFNVQHSVDAVVTTKPTASTRISRRRNARWSMRLIVLEGIDMVIRRRDSIHFVFEVARQAKHELIRKSVALLIQLQQLCFLLGLFVP
jgi:hypothetical protein